MSFISKTPQVPYFAVIFTSTRTGGDRGYGNMSDKMVELAAEQPGFLGMESVRDESGQGITVSYWESLDSIKNWREHSLHQVAQSKGKSEWYNSYALRVCKVERDKFFEI